MSAPRRRFVALSMAALGVLAMACGGGIPGSCDLPNAMVPGPGYCVTYTGASYTTMNVMTSCSTAMGTYSASACKAGSMGLCTFHGGTTTEYVETYELSSPDAGAFSFSSTCATAGGAFSAM